MSDDDQVTPDDTATQDDADAQPVVEETPAEETQAEETPAEEAPAEEGAEAPTGDAPAATPAGVDAQGRQLFTTVCSNCGNETQVPFQPAAGRPVFCRDCFIKKQQESRGGN